MEYSLKYGVNCCRGSRGAVQLLVMMNLQNTELSGAGLLKAASFRELLSSSGRKNGVYL